MTAQNFETLRARAQALGYRLFVTTEGTQLVTETTPDGIEIAFIHESDIDDDLEGWIADREQVSERVRRGKSPAVSGRADNDTSLERARDKAQTTVYDVRFLIEGALTLNREGEDDGPLERVLQTAWEKLVALGEALDSVNWPAGAASRAAATSPRESVAETDAERALRLLDRAERLLNVCRASVDNLDLEHSADVALTMGNEIFSAIEEARSVLRGGEKEGHAQ